jgi:hypothetical protein
MSLCLVGAGSGSKRIGFFGEQGVSSIGVLTLNFCLAILLVTLTRMTSAIGVVTTGATGVVMVCAT